jgi:hypothetical protein
VAGTAGGSIGCGRRREHARAPGSGRPVGGKAKSSLAGPHVNAARALFGTCSAQRLFPAPTLSVGGCSAEDPNPTTSYEARHLANKIWGPRRRPTNRLQQPTSKHAGAFYMVHACEATREDDDDLCTVLVVASCKREDHGRMHRRNQR